MPKMTVTLSLSLIHFHVGIYVHEYMNRLKIDKIHIEFSDEMKGCSGALLYF